MRKTKSELLDCIPFLMLFTKPLSMNASGNRC